MPRLSVTKGSLQRIIARAFGGVAVVMTLVGAVVLTPGSAFAGETINGTGSSFAAPALTQWDTDVSHAPYSITVNYESSSSGQGRFEFTNQTADFAASDVGYVDSSTGSVPPSFPFDFIPITAAGVAFMYNIPGLTQKLQLTSYTACLALTGQVTNWDDPVFQQNGANAGVTMPNLPIKPVTEEDPAGTNYVLEEYCIDEQPAVWAQYATKVASSNAEGVTINATTPGSNWVAPGNGYNEDSTAAVASTIVANPGGIGAVQENYAIDSQFTGSNPGQAVASVQNASGDFTQPTPVDVASALAYATQNPDGTHKLDFGGAGPNVYNPSTYSYLLTQTTKWNAAQGAIMSQYVNYVLTLGQHEAPSMDFASLGLSLERYGIDQVIADVPGAVDPTATESQAYACGDLTPAEVQAGQTTPTCGVTNGSPPPAPPGAPAVATSAGSGSGSATAPVSGGAATTTTIAKKAVAAKTTTKKAVTSTSAAKGSISGGTTTTKSAAPVVLALADVGTPLSAITKAATALTVTVLASGVTASVAVPAGALPTGSIVSVYPVTVASAAEKHLPAGGWSYLTSFDVSWKDPAGAVPAALHPITATITDSAITSGAALYSATTTESAAIGTAVKSGTVTGSFTSDPLLFVAHHSSSAATVTTVPSATTATTVVSSTATITSTTPTTVATTGGASSTGSAGVALAGSSETKPLAFTGFNPFPLVIAGLALFGLGCIGRRYALRRPRRSA